MILHCDLDLEDRKPIFLIDTVALDDHNTKFGSKGFSRSEDIIWTNIH